MMKSPWIEIILLVVLSVIAKVLYAADNLTGALLVVFVIVLTALKLRIAQLMFRAWKRRQERKAQEELAIADW